MVSQVEKFSEKYLQGLRNLPNEEESKEGEVVGKAGKVLKSISEVIEESAQKIGNYIGRKLVYIDWAKILFGKIYTIENKSLITLASELPSLNDEIKYLKKALTRNYFLIVLNDLYKYIIEGKPIQSYEDISNI
jgi:hypothetical protein